MSIVDGLKKHAGWGVISQLIVTLAAIVIAFIEGTVASFAGLIWVADKMGPKYGPPPGATPTPTPTPGIEILPGVNLLSLDGIATLLVALFSILLYLWAIFGWVFWGAILYLRFKDKKQ